MLVTNMKIILGTGIPEKDLKALMKRLSAKAQKDLDIVTGNAFPVVKEPYLHFENKVNIPLPDLKELFRAEDQELLLRAIGDEVIQVPGFVFKGTKIPLTPEIKEEIAESMCQTQEELEAVEAEKKDHAKMCSGKIEGLEKVMDELVTRYRKGYDEKEVKCVIQFDFENKAKNFISEETGEVIASEELQPVDYQMQIDFTPGEEPEVKTLPGLSPTTESDLPFANPEETEGT